jgi:hypothetical protein
MTDERQPPGFYYSRETAITSTTPAELTTPVTAGGEGLPGGGCWLGLQAIGGWESHRVVIARGETPTSCAGGLVVPQDAPIIWLWIDESYDSFRVFGAKNAAGDDSGKLILISGTWGKRV